MAFFKWIDSYSTGVKEMDFQHKKIVELIDQLHETIKTGAEKDIRGEVISSLVKSTVTHFAAEERLMQQYGYPGFHDHQRKHGDMIRKIKEVNARHNEGLAGLTADIISSLRTWLITHMQGEDQAYGRFIMGS